MTATILEIEFPAAQQRIVGRLHLPDQQPAAAIVTTGPLTSVKEQVCSNYAVEMAQRGFAVLTFDHRHFGASEGEPRQLESPSRKIADIQAAADWLNSRSAVAGCPIFGMGICAGAGYMVRAAAGSSAFRGIVTVAGYFPDADATRRGMGEKFELAFEAARASEARFLKTGDAEFIPSVGLDNPNVAMPLRDAYEYYSNPSRGAVPTYVNRMALQSRVETLTFDSQSAAGEIDVPFLLVHAEKALAPGFARQFFERVESAKSSIWLDAPKQTAFYDDPAIINRVGDECAIFVGGTLDGTGLKSLKT